MTATAVHDRNAKAGEYLQLLRSLAREMERAMQAIAHNRLPDLEESVSSQQHMSARLLHLSGEITPYPQSAPAFARPGIDASPLDAELLEQVLAANDTLQSLNRRYAALLEHSSRSIALMAVLLSSYQGRFQKQFPQQIKEASGAGFEHHTWSCRM